MAFENKKRLVVLAVLFSSVATLGSIILQDSPLVSDSFTFEEIEASSTDVTCADLLALNSTSVLNGTSGNDILLGTNSSETMFGFDGDDIICGFEGNDIIFGGNGNDILIGGNGSNILIGGNDTDACDGITNDTSITACEIQLPEAIEIEKSTIQNSASIISIEGIIADIQVVLASHTSTLNTNEITHDEVNKIVTAGPVFLNQDTIFQALCHPDNEFALTGSRLGIVTNGTDTISNVESLNVGNLTVTVDFETVPQGLIMGVTNGNLQNVTGNASVVCVDFSN